MNLLRKLRQKQIEVIDWVFPSIEIVRKHFEIVPKVYGDDFRIDYEVLNQSSVVRNTAQKLQKQFRENHHKKVKPRVKPKVKQ